MAIAVGKLEYTVKSSPVRARGLSHTSKQLQGALLNPVSSIVFDVEGIAKVHGLLSGIAETEFETNNLRY